MSRNVPWIHDTGANTSNASLWDVMTLGGVSWAGVWAIEVGKKRELDIVKVRRLDGVRIRDNGYFGVTLKATGRIWTPEDWEAFQDILPLFDPQRPGGGRSPLDIYHPAAALFGVHTVYIESLEMPQPGNGIVTISMGLVQWFPAPKPFVQGFAGTSSANKPLFLDSDRGPSTNTGANL